MNENPANSEENEIGQAPAKQKCVGLKKDGARCGAWPVLGGELCAGHAGLGIAADPEGYAHAGNRASVQARSERAERRKMSLQDHLAAVLERDAGQIARELRAAGKQGDWRATEALITRVHGKPVERVQVEDVDPLGVAAMTADERRALMAKVLEDHPGLAVLVPRTSRVQPDAQSRMDTGAEG